MNLLVWLTVALLFPFLQCSDVFLSLDCIFQISSLQSNFSAIYWTTFMLLFGTQISVVYTMNVSVVKCNPLSLRLSLFMICFICSIDIGCLGVYIQEVSKAGPNSQSSKSLYV